MTGTEPGKAPEAGIQAGRPLSRSVAKATNPFARSLSALLIGLIRLYQWTLSPYLGQQCRFYPTCSHYAVSAVSASGPVRGGWAALKRLLKCHPFHPGGVDLPPAP